MPREIPPPYDSLNAPGLQPLWWRLHDSTSAAVHAGAPCHRLTLLFDAGAGIGYASVDGAPEVIGATGLSKARRRDRPVQPVLTCGPRKPRPVTDLAAWLADEVEWPKKNPFCWTAR